MKLKNYLDNIAISQNPLGHSFVLCDSSSSNTLSSNTLSGSNKEHKEKEELRCVICYGIIEQNTEYIQCENCGNNVHENCLERFHKTHCSMKIEIEPEIIQKAKK